MKRNKTKEVKAEAILLLSKEPTIFVYDYIEAWGVTAKDMVAMISGIVADRMHIRIHSYGGNPDDALAIYEALRRKSEAGTEIWTHNDNMCASSSSIIYLAGDRRFTSALGSFLLHSPYVENGTEADVVVMSPEDQKRLEILKNAMVKLYVDRLETTEEKVLEYLSTDSWFSALDARSINLATDIEEMAKIAASAVPYHSLMEPIDETKEEKEAIKVKMEPEIKAEIEEKEIKEEIKETKEVLGFDRESLKVMVAKYGKDIALQVMMEGGDEAKAQSLYIESLKAENEELKKVVPAKAGAKPLAIQISESNQPKVKASTPFGKALAEAKRKASQN